MLQKSISEQNNTSKMWHGSTNQQQRSHTRSYAVYVYNSSLPFLEQQVYCTPEFQNPGAVNYFQNYFCIIVSFLFFGAGSLFMVGIKSGSRIERNKSEGFQQTQI